MDTQPDTGEVDRSEIRTQILLATASSALKGRRSFTHMLTEVRQAGRKHASYHRSDAAIDRYVVMNTGRMLGKQCVKCCSNCTISELFIFSHADWVVFHPHKLLTYAKISVLIGGLLFREKRADAEAPVFPMASAAAFAHSGCPNKPSDGSC